MRFSKLAGFVQSVHHPSAIDLERGQVSFLKDGL
jgi:hypothetical protein